MKNLLDRDLELMHKEVLMLGALCEEAISLSIKALMQKDETLAKKVIELEILTNKKERDIEDICLKALLRQQPVAKDLRKVSATLKMITDMERIADQARDIAEISMTIDLSKTNCKLQEIAHEATKMVTNSLDCYVTSDLKACKKVIKDDKIVNALFAEIKGEIVSFVSKDSSKALEGMYVLMIAKYYERISDHATNIAEWVEFSVTGSHKGDNLF